MGRSRGVAVAVAGLVLAVGGCAEGGTDEKAARSSAEPKPTRSPSSSPSPSSELVEWAGDMCESTVALRNLRKESAADLKEIRDSDDETGMLAHARALSYLSTTPADVETVAGDLEAIGASGVPAADRLRDALRKKVRSVANELEAQSPAVGLEYAESTVADADKRVQSLTPPQPDLPTLAEKIPRLAAAYERAEQCAPGWKPGGASGDGGSPAPDATGPLPKAADGRNYAACSDGACEVLVTSTADITAKGTKVHVIVADDSITFQSGGGLMQFGGAGGEAGFGNGLKANVVAHNKDGAVLKFSRP
ncbi:hypothetical protein [Streptomyces coeruleorubidus]|uniref:Uncharacterized protein n=1 Tax=Streptomyces coeruleorubidus TaxID=116188 RepID=A0A5J6I2L5_STRC4|nr:hypothetical protein [Streptomyces coeruleorubidus]QEV26719.1 hypothetical protein CP976_22985 [Streptomyces coeruleorubidus]GGT63792.1 hypothetical protein GCM10010256_21710 [Streptomyces coeruleorubidus]